VERLRQVRASRDTGRLSGALQAVRQSAEGGDNVMPSLLDAVRAQATVGEICEVWRQVWGEYREVPIL
jgi:methylmalonyl-CoA mutase N-terminal domain/subunit